jgi:membrane dipeptidase
MIGLFALALAVTTPAPAPIPPAVMARIDRVLKKTPLIDGHNDIAETLWERKGRSLWQADVSRGLAGFHTDIARLRAGRVGGQFWSVYVDQAVRGPAAVAATLREIDIVRGLIARYPNDLELASTADDIVRIHKAGRIASLMGAEGGQQIDNSLPVLRQYYALGVRYLTLAHSRNVDWVDSATDAPAHGGLTPFGLAVVAEMNRIGMLVDLSHVSPAVMKQAIAASRAPVIFSHSSARALNDHPRNVPDDVLASLPTKDGVVMANLVPGFLRRDYWQWSAARDGEQTRVKALNPADPAAATTALAAWDAAHPAPVVTVKDWADHVDHIGKVAGRDHVGLGADYDGIPAAPVGLDGVDSYPRLFAELIARGWSDADLAGLAGGNVLRVMRKAEAVAAASKNMPIADPDIAVLDAAPR